MDKPGISPFSSQRTRKSLPCLKTSLKSIDLCAPTMLGMQSYQHMHYYFTPPIVYSPGAILVSTASKEKLRQQSGGSETMAYNDPGDADL